MSRLIETLMKPRRRDPFRNIMRQVRSVIARHDEVEDMSEEEVAAFMKGAPELGPPIYNPPYHLLPGMGGATKRYFKLEMG